VIVATRVQHAVATTIATTTSPTKGKVVSVAAKSLFLVDAAVLQKCCCISISYFFSRIHFCSSYC